MVHWDDGSYFVFSNPFVGPQMFRKTENPTSLLDWGDIRLYRSIRFYHQETNTEYEFKTNAIRIRHTVENGLPIFDVTGTGKDKEVRLRLKAYARACWRFQQPGRWVIKSILHYNEYPAEVVGFSFAARDRSLKVKKDDLGESASNLEHTWGKLIWFLSFSWSQNLKELSISWCAPPFLQNERRLLARAIMALNQLSTTIRQGQRLKIVNLHNELGIALVCFGLRR